MTTATATAVVAEVLPDLVDAPPEVQQPVYREVLYALRVLDRPGLDDEAEATR